LVAGAASSSAEINPQKIYRKALPSVMTLEVENQAGRKFVAAPSWRWRTNVAVTAWHVVCDARSGVATFDDGTRVESNGLHSTKT